jgi:hypothetical protein
MHSGMHILDTVTLQETFYSEDHYVRFEYWEPDSRHFVVLTDDLANPNSNQPILMRGAVGESAFTPIEDFAATEPDPVMPGCAP